MSRQVLVAFIFSTPSSEAVQFPAPTVSKLDRRLYTTAYEENQVYPIHAVNSLVTSIVFAENEKVD